MFSELTVLYRLVPSLPVLSGGLVYFVFVVGKASADYRPYRKQRSAC